MRPNTPDNSQSPKQQPSSSNMSLQEFLQNGTWSGIAGANPQNTPTKVVGNSTGNSDSDDETPYDPSKYRQMMTSLDESKPAVTVSPAATFGVASLQQSATTEERNIAASSALARPPSWQNNKNVNNQVHLNNMSCLPHSLQINPPPTPVSPRPYAFRQTAVIDERNKISIFHKTAPLYSFATPLYQEQFLYYLYSNQMNFCPYDLLLGMSREQPSMITEYVNARVHEFSSVLPKREKEAGKWKLEIMIGQVPAALHDCPCILAEVLRMIASFEHIDMTVYKIIFGKQGSIVRVKLFLTREACDILFSKFCTSSQEQYLRNSGIFFAPDGVISISTQKSVQFLIDEIIPSYNSRMRRRNAQTIPSGVLNIELYRNSKFTDIECTTMVATLSAACRMFPLNNAQQQSPLPESSQQKQQYANVGVDVTAHNTLLRTTNSVNNTPLNLNVHASPYTPSPSSSM